MSKNYDSGSNSAHATPHGWENNRNIEYNNADNEYDGLYIDAAGDLWYTHGQDNTWNDTQLTGAAGVLGHNVAVGNCSMAISRGPNHVHVAYVDITNMEIHHAHCSVPSNPIAANWLGFPAVKHQRVDAPPAADKHCVSICDDGTNGAGASEFHIVWDEDPGGGNWCIKYSGGAGGGHAPTAPVTLANTPGEQHPTIVCATDTGRQLYAFWVSAAPAPFNIECMRVVDPANPALVASWGGPAAGAGMGPDVAIGGAGIDTCSPPSASWWWDANERVIVTTVLVGTTNNPVTDVWDESAGPPAWLGDANGSNPGFGTPVGNMIVNRGNSNKWTMYCFNNLGGHTFALKDNGYSFAGVTHYTQATTTPVANSFMTCEWRHFEIISANHSCCRWVDAVNNLWYGESRINTASTPVVVGPTAGAYYDETAIIPFAWTFTDSEADTQREYYVEIDDDGGFGSPVADPGSGLRLNTWTSSVLDAHDLNASVLTANTTYYWRVRTRDSEYGTEYDPNSESGYSDGLDTLKTTAIPTLNVTSSSQQASGSVAVNFTVVLPAGHFSGTYELTNYEVDDGGGYGVMTRDATLDSPVGELLALLSIDAGTNYYTFGWDAPTDLAADYDDDVDFRLTGQWLADSHGLGTTNDTLLTQPVDLADPTGLSVSAPIGGSTTRTKNTFTIGASDTNGWEFKAEIYRDSGYTQLFDSTADASPAVAGTYKGVGTTTWSTTIPLNDPGTWYFRYITRDGTVTQNENDAWTTGSFTFSPPPDPQECRDGTWTLQVDPTKLWTGSEFDVLDDCVGAVGMEDPVNGPQTLRFTLNDVEGRYGDPSSATLISMGDEVKMTRGTLTFYGTVKERYHTTAADRRLDIYCESFTGSADSHFIQLRVGPTAETGLYWEDYIRLGMMNAGLEPRWFTLVNLSGTEIFYDNEDDKTPVLATDDILYDRVTLVEFLNDIVTRTGKIWYEGHSIPNGRKAYIYWGDSVNPTEGTADHTFYLENEVMQATMRYDMDSLINRVVFKDQPVVEQDMNSIREYGVFAYQAKSQGITNYKKLIEIAQYILNEKSTPRALGQVPLAGTHIVSPNQLAQIYQEDADATKSGFSGLYTVKSVHYSFGERNETTLELTSRWENPLIKDINELLRESSSNEELTIVRVETGECRLECPTNGVVLAEEDTDTVGRLGVDRISDTATDSDYYTVYGGPS